MKVVQKPYCDNFALLNFYTIFPKNPEEEFDKSSQTHSIVKLSKSGAAGENRTLDPTLTKGVLYH
jgi:hypothetical protein